MSQAAAGSVARGRFLRGAVAALLVAAAAVAPSAIPASAYQIQTAALTGATGTNGTAMQTFPSGLTATWATTGVTTVSSLTNGMCAKAGTSAMFTPGITAATAMPDFVTDGAGCAANSVCADRGTITPTFNRPVRNPVLHLAGLGGYASQSGQTSTVRAKGTITSTSPGGATLAAPAANAVNLAVSNAGLTWDTSVTRPAVGCATTTIPAQNGLAGCGSIPVTGLVSLLVFRIDLVVETAGGWYTYRVTGHRVVAPGQSEVVAANPDDPAAAPALAMLTLTTCHPVYSARRRWVVHAVLDTIWAR